MKKIGENFKILLLFLLILELFFVYSFDGIKDSIKTGQTFFSPDGELLRSIVLGDGESETETQITELTGTLEVIVVDDFENQKADYLYYLNVDGERYELEGEDIPMAPGAEISVSGTVRGSTISASSSSINLVSDLEPWPKTLGEQKYVVVYLLNESEMGTFNETNFTNFVFDRVNNWVKEESYGKVEVDYGKILVFNGTCNPSWIGDESIFDKVDSEINFLEESYFGIIVNYPSFCEEGFFSTSGSFGKFPHPTDEGRVDLAVIFMGDYPLRNYLDTYVKIFIHEMGHNFFLLHSSSLNCGEFPNRKPLASSCQYYEYRDPYDAMGTLEDVSYNLRNKEVTLGWINEQNVPEVLEGVFFVSPFENDSTGTSNFHGLKIPVMWNISTISISPGYSVISPPPTNISQEVNYYFLEYRTKFPEVDNSYYDNEFTYGLNLSNITKGVFLRLGRGKELGFFDWPLIQDTLLLGIHPNANVTGEVYYSWMYPHFSFLLKNESYIDEFNNMKITVLDMNETGALINISKLYTCADITNDGRVSSPDIIAMVNYIFRGGSISVPDWVVDVNGNGLISGSDVIHLVNYVFRAGPAPVCNPSNFVTTQTVYTQVELQDIENQLADAGITMDITPDTKTTPKVASFD